MWEGPISYSPIHRDKSINAKLENCVAPSKALLLLPIGGATNAEIGTTCHRNCYLTSAASSGPDNGCNYTALG